MRRYYRESDITDLLLQVKKLTTKTPKNSVYSRMLLDKQERFVCIGPGVFGLREVSNQAGSPAAASTAHRSKRKVRIPLFPLYSEMALRISIRPATFCAVTFVEEFEGKEHES
jgi:hypothetical protein